MNRFQRRATLAARWRDLGNARAPTLLHESDIRLLAGGIGQISRAHVVAMREFGVAERRHPRAAHLARREFAETIQYIRARLGLEARTPVMVAANVAVELGCDAPRGMRSATNRPSL